MKNRKIDVVPGSTQFDSMSFTLNRPVRSENVDDLSFEGHQLKRITPKVYSMPAYLSANFNLMFVVAPLVQNDWTIAFSTAKIKQSPNGGPAQVTDLSSPMPAGKGLNKLSKYSPNLSNKLLAYFRSLSDVGTGHWALIRSVPNSQH